MKGLLIIIFASAIIFAISLIVENYSEDVTTTCIASQVKDISGIALTMLTFWFIYCVIC